MEVELFVASTRKVRCELFHISSLTVSMPVRVSFYGLKADAAMAANVFEVSYNLTLDKGIKEYGKKGKSKSIMDYRCALDSEGNDRQVPFHSKPLHTLLVLNTIVDASELAATTHYHFSQSTILCRQFLSKGIQYTSTEFVRLRLAACSPLCTCVVTAVS